MRFKPSLSLHCSVIRVRAFIILLLQPGQEYPHRHTRLQYYAGRFFCGQGAGLLQRRRFGRRTYSNDRHPGEFGADVRRGAVHQRSGGGDERQLAGRQFARALFQLTSGLCFGSWPAHRSAKSKSSRARKWACRGSIGGLFPASRVSVEQAWHGAGKGLHACFRPAIARRGFMALQNNFIDATIMPLPWNIMAQEAGMHEAGSMAKSRY